MICGTKKARDVSYGHWAVTSCCLRSYLGNRSTAHDWFSINLEFYFLFISYFLSLTSIFTFFFFGEFRNLTTLCLLFFNGFSLSSFFLSLLSFLWIGAQFPQEKFLSYGRILTLHYYFLLMCILFSNSILSSTPLIEIFEEELSTVGFHIIRDSIENKIHIRRK